MKETLEKLLEPLDALTREITVNKEDVITEKNINFFVKRYLKKFDVRETLKNMMEAIYEGVNLPCKEQAQLLVTQSLYYCNVSKLLDLKVER